MKDSKFRDQIAMNALTAFLNNPANYDCECEELTTMCYNIADAMLVARGNTSEDPSIPDEESSTYPAGWEENTTGIAPCGGNYQVDIWMKGGIINAGWYTSDIDWSIEGCVGDVLYYRIKE